MFRHARAEGRGKQKKCVDEREESFTTIPQILKQEQRKQSLYT